VLVRLQTAAAYPGNPNPSQENTMLRKLIVLAVTTGLAKKAYDYYKEKNGQAATEPSGSSRQAMRKPGTRSRASANKPDAS
jgi:hypothetical protein